MTDAEPDKKSAATILAASGTALLAAAALLVTIVLPAEYGWDPLGTGAALGLTELSESEHNPLIAQSQPWHSDSITFQLAPYEAVEYKYGLNTGAVILFNWQSDGELLYDMHAEPEGAAPGYAETFSKSRASSGTGSYSAPFNGIHGWYWQNRGRQEVTLTLQTQGYFSESIEMRDGREFRYTLEVQKLQP
ncbi:MAG: hypothetical protein ACI9NT_000954 [Bacteroidia bacterium]|jgi:hypothetical protein